MGGAALLLTEHSPINRRGFYGSLIQMGTILGVVFGNLFFLAVQYFTNQEQFMAWGWRVPFLSGVLLVIVGIYVQLKIEDTPVFREMQRRQAVEKKDVITTKPPLATAIRVYWPQILQAAGAFFVVNGTFYLLIAGMLSYGVAGVGMSYEQILTCVLIAITTQVVTIPFFGGLSDRIGRRKLYLTGAVLMGAYAFPLFWMVDTGSLIIVTFALAIAFTLHAVMFGPQAALFAEMFPADVRYSGASLGFQLASIFAGGLAPMVMTWLISTTGTSASVSAYIVCMAVVTFVAVFTIHERFQADLNETSRDISDREALAARKVADR